MHVVGYDTQDGPKDVSCAYEWIAGLLDMTNEEARDHEFNDLVRSAGEVDVFPIYATDLACMWCENNEDHEECEDERCEDCDGVLR